MHSIAYTAMADQISAGSYTEVSAKITIANLYARQQVTGDEYNDLMDKADKLAANDAGGAYLTRIVALETAVHEMRDEMAAIRQVIEEGGTAVPDPAPGKAGSMEDPIDAVRGMTYYRGKIYRDPEDGKLYECSRDNDNAPGTGVALAYLPHELISIYFVEVDEV